MTGPAAPSGQPAPSGSARIPRRVLLRFTALVLFLLATLGALRGAWWSPVALIGLYLVLAPIGLPMSPLILVGGAIFGPLEGGALNLVGCFLGAFASFVLARALGREMVVHLLGKRLKRAEQMLRRLGFWALVGVRFIPMPFVVTNFSAALAGVRLPLFLGSTAVGLVPPVAIYSYFAAELIRAASGGGRDAGLERNIALAVGGLLLLSLVPQIWTRWRRKQRLAELRRRRAAR